MNKRIVSENLYVSYEKYWNILISFLVSVPGTFQRSIIRQRDSVRILGYWNIRRCKERCHESIFYVQEYNRL